MKQGESRKDRLLTDPNVKRWYDNIARGSASSADEWLRRLGYIQDRFKLTPQKLAKMTEKAAADFLLDVVSALEKEDKRSEYISNYVKSLKSWWRHCGKKIDTKVNLRRDSDEGKYAEEVPPTDDELRRILDMADARAKIAVTTIAFGGTRLEALGSFLGDDGLELRDLPDLTLSNGKITFEKVPTLVRVRSSISKAGHAYLTFLCQQACDYLVSYLQWRIQNGEQLGPHSPVFTATPQQPKYLGKHVRTINVGDSIRKAIREAGYSWRPYVLRRYFESRMQMAEADHLVIQSWINFWSGWKGDISSVYTTRKALPEDLIEKMRDAYAKAADKYLVTSKRESVSQDMMVATFNRQFLTMAGYSEKEIAQFGDLSKLSAQDVQDLIQKKSMKALGLNGNGHQKIVPIGEVKNWILEGWEFVQQLPSGEAVVKLPQDD
jgi:hypothetical protein